MDRSKAFVPTPRGEEDAAGHDNYRLDESTLKGKIGKRMKIYHARLELGLIVFILADVILLSTEAMIDNRWACADGHVSHGATPEHIRNNDALKGGGAHDEVHMLGKRRDLQQFMGVEDDEHQTFSTYASLQERSISGERDQGEHHHNHAGVHGRDAFAEPVVCETRNGNTVHQIAHTCHLVSIVILCYFELELLVKMWLEPSDFFESRSECLDFLFVSVSLAIDIFLLCVIDLPSMEWIPVALVFCQWLKITRESAVSSAPRGGSVNASPRTESSESVKESSESVNDHDFYEQIKVNILHIRRKREMMSELHRMEQQRQDNRRTLGSFVSTCEHLLFSKAYTRLGRALNMHNFTSKNNTPAPLTP